MAILSQFLLRLISGLAVGMAITSPQKVTSGYFRNHLYVTLGLATLAALAISRSSYSVASLASGAAVFSFFGAAAWLYEARRVGVALLWCVAACALAAALVGRSADGSPVTPLGVLSVATSGLVLGLTMAAMLLGHWYLNSPGMELAPLRRLLVALAIAVGLQMLISGIYLVGDLSTDASNTSLWLMLVLLRWAFGLLGVLVLIWMAWETLKIPNTQSATGILYVAVIGTFVGELSALLLSASTAFPL